MVVNNMLGQRARVLCRVGGDFTTTVDGVIKARVIILHADGFSGFRRLRQSRESRHSALDAGKQFVEIVVPGQGL